MTKGLEPKKDVGVEVSILSDGTFRTQVPPTTAGAVVRNYETSDGKKGTKYELVYRAVVGTVKAFDIFESDFGKSVIVTLDEGEELKTVYFNMNSNFGTDFLKKLPNLDLSKPVRFIPYAFEDEKTNKPKKGLTLMQDDVKIADAYRTKEGDKWVHKNGFPVPEGDTGGYDSDDWKLYFLGVKKFLLTELAKHPLYKKIPAEPSIAYPTAEKEGVNVDEIPF